MNDPTCLCKTEMTPGKKRFAAVFSNLVQPLSWTSPSACS